MNKNQTLTEPDLISPQVFVEIEVVTVTCQYDSLPCIGELDQRFDDSSPLESSKFARMSSITMGIGSDSIS